MAAKKVVEPKYEMTKLVIPIVAALVFGLVGGWAGNMMFQDTRIQDRVTADEKETRDSFAEFYRH